MFLLGSFSHERHNHRLCTSTTSYWEDALENRRAIGAYAEWPLRSRQYWRRQQAILHQKFETFVRQYDSDSVMYSIKFERELLQYMKEGSYSMCANCYGLQMAALDEIDLFAPRRPSIPKGTVCIWLKYEGSPRIARIFRF